MQSLRLREQWEAEIDQARQIQQLLIPEAIPTIPGFVLETEYRPAQQVGGDFFQIIPDNAGGVLIIVGDVTGKGLQAGMQVALIVGAIRTIVETSHEPQVVLESLNRQTLQPRPVLRYLRGPAHRGGWQSDHCQCRAPRAVSEWQRTRPGRQSTPRSQRNSPL